MPEGIYDEGDSGFINAIQNCIAEACDSTAILQTVMNRKFSDPNGNPLSETTQAEAYQKFLFEFSRLLLYCAEILPPEIVDSGKDFIKKSNLVDYPDADEVSEGISLLEELQGHLHQLGLKNTAIDINVFDFQCYYD